MNRILLKLIILVLLGTLMSGCMVSGGILIEREPVVIGDSPRKVELRREHHQKGIKHHIKIPLGQQPHPVSCHRIRHKIPYGVIVVRG